MTFDLFMVWSILCPSCCGNTGRLLHGFCKYAGERMVAHGPLVFFFFFFFFCLFFFNKGNNFCDFLFAFLNTNPFSKGVLSKRKEVSPTRKALTTFEKVVSREVVYIPLRSHSFYSRLLYRR